MKKSIGLVFLAFVFLTVLLSGCTPASTPVPPTPIPPTDTPVPTAMPTKPPTSTPIPPTPTVEPPSLATEFLTDVQVLETDNFNNLNNWSTWNSASGKLSDGMFELQGQTGYLSGVGFNQKIGEGYGVAIKYKLVNNVDYKSQFIVTTGEWQTNSFRQIGIYNGRKPKAALYQGKNIIGGNNLLCTNLTLQKDTWYNFLIVVGKGGEFLSAIQNPDNPLEQCVYHETIKENWTGLNFEFQVIADIGETVYIDDFMLLSFGEIKQ